jgi:hypothetical protein
MSQWDAQTPGVCDRDGLEALVGRLAEHLGVLGEQASRVEAVVAQTQGSWTGLGADAWVERGAGVAGLVRGWDGPLRAGAQAVNDYVWAVVSIGARAQVAVEDLETARGQVQRARQALARLRALPDPDDFEVRLALGRVQRFEEDEASAVSVLRWLGTERREADQMLVARLRGAMPAAWSGSGGLAATLDPGAFCRQGGAGVDLSALGLWACGLAEGVQGDAALRWLAGRLSGEDLEALLARCPALAVRLMRADTTGAFEAAYPGLATALLVEDPDARIAAVLEAFAGLSAEEVAVLARTYPGVVHNLDGAPLGVRITANRIAIRATITDAEQRLAALDARIAELEELCGYDRGRWGDELLRCRLERDDLRWRIPWCESLLTGDADPGEYDPYQPPTGHQVVLFDPDAGQFGELVGDVDAPNVAVLVGGTGTNLTTMDGQFDRAWDLVSGGGEQLAVITYLGGPMPQDAVTNSPWRHFADTIAPHLASFANGVRAASDAAITVAGHSYGGLVVGTAEANGMVVDRILLIEASGSGVRSVQEYAAPDTPRYSMTAPGDFIEPVQASEAHGRDPDELDGVVRLETGRTVDTDPSSDLLSGFGSHSQVFGVDTTAWKNIYNVMTGGQVDLWTPPSDIPIGVGVNGMTITERHFPMEDPSYVPPTQDVP